MIFKAEKDLYVKVSNKYLQRATGLKGFYFDKDGHYETKNEVLIKALKDKFEVAEPIKEIVKVEVKPTLHYAGVTPQPTPPQKPAKPITKPTPKKGTSHKK